MKKKFFERDNLVVLNDFFLNFRPSKISFSLHLLNIELNLTFQLFMNFRISLAGFKLSRCAKFRLRIRLVSTQNIW